MREVKLPEWLETLSDITSDIRRFKESAEDYAEAIASYKAALERQKARPVPIASDKLIETLKTYFDLRLKALEEGVAALIESRNVMQPSSIVIFKGPKNGGDKA